MRRKMVRSISLVVTSTLCLMVVQRAAIAGPPLICHPFDIGNARSLPFSAEQWRGIDRRYDDRNLVKDTLGLLAPETPTLVRMETLRRATIYCLLPTADVRASSTVKNEAIASELLSQLKARIPEPGIKSDKRAAAFATFDYGYLVEAYKQAGDASQGPKLAGGVDGYGLIVKAIALRGGDPEMELAAALACGGKRLKEGRPAYLAHLRRAAAGADEGSLLARNLITHFNGMGKTIAELRANTATSKN